MALSRAAMIAEGAGLHAQVLTLAGLTSVDDAANMGSVANVTFRALGVAQADLATGVAATGKEAKALAYFNFFLLDRAVSALVRKMDVEGTGAKAKLSQQIANVERQRALAMAIAHRHGLPDYSRRTVIASAAATGLDLPDFFTRDQFAISGFSDAEINELPA